MNFSAVGGFLSARHLVSPPLRMLVFNLVSVIFLSSFQTRDALEDSVVLFSLIRSLTLMNCIIPGDKGPWCGGSSDFIL